MVTRSASSPVMLRGGSSVPAEALQLLWSLEDDGFDLRLSADGGLLVSPRDRLTDDDRRAIRTHKRALVMLVQYCGGIQ